MPTNELIYGLTLSPGQLKADARPAVARYLPGEQGPNHRVWKKVVEATDVQGGMTETNTQERVQWVTNTAYVELATGLNYRDEQGNYQETKEEFTLEPGWAVARKGPHKAFLAYNLNTRGSVGVEQPDGKVLRSQVVGLSYFDYGSGQSVLIGEIKDCAGTVLPPNQVIYEDAFTEVKADVRYTYTKAGLEQDVILRTQLPEPEIVPPRAAAQSPAWWTVRAVFSPGASATDYAIANQGQAKWFALKAEEELMAKLPAGFRTKIYPVSAGQPDGLPSGNNYLPINQGQLKALVKPLYDRIQQARAANPTITITLPTGSPGIYPWTDDTGDDESYAPVNTGQLKYALGFEFDKFTQ